MVPLARPREAGVSTKWHDPRLELARPPARPAGVEWRNTIPWLCLAAFWAVVALISAYLVGAF